MPLLVQPHTTHHRNSSGKPISKKTVRVVGIHYLLIVVSKGDFSRELVFTLLLLNSVGIFFIDRDLKKFFSTILLVFLEPFGNGAFAAEKK